MNRNSAIISIIVAIIFVATAVSLGKRFIQGDSHLLRDASVMESSISPNADGENDITLVQYELSRNADVSIYFEDGAGERFYFRREKTRGAGEYRVHFSGVVEGYRLPDEMIQGEIIARLLQDGAYTWTITAMDEDGAVEQAQGQIAIVNADPHLPEIRDFNLDKHTFSPNQDGLADRVKPQFDLTKEVEELRVFLLLSDGVEMPITELERDVPAKMPGYHVYDYDGGVDRKATPPEDGTYPVIAIARDAEGQQIRAEQSLTIQFGGVPRAEFVSPPIGDTLRFEATAVSLCDTLQFEVTIENYGDTPIRTTGPAPNIVYDSSWNYNTLGWGTESGAWRVGIGYENALSDYPFRWAIGTEADLQEIDGHLYLMPGERTIVTGSIRITDVLGERNPQPMWVGLIHEDVEISQFNQRVDAKAIRIDLPDPGNIQPCQPREIPKR